MKWNWEPEHIPDAAEYEAMPEVVTIFGGEGFLQKYVIDTLVENPGVSTIRVGTLWPEEFAANIPEKWQGKVVAEFVDIKDQHSILAASEGSQALINMLDQTYEVEHTFYDIHVGATKFISHAANVVMASRVIHVSSLASRVDSWSRYSETKFRGEDMALANFPWTTILRFGPLFGKENPAIEQFKEYMKLAPLYPCVASKTKVQPTFAGDAAKAIVAAMSDPSTRELQYDLGGPQTYTHAGLVKEVMNLGGSSRPVVSVPGVVGDCIVAGLQWLPDPLVTRDMVYLIRSHHVANHESMRSWADLVPSYTPKTLAEGFNE